MDAKRIILVDLEKATQEFKAWFDKLENKYQNEKVYAFAADDDSLYNEFKSFKIVHSGVDCEEPSDLANMVEIVTDPANECSVDENDQFVKDYLSKHPDVKLPD